ncbi:hypothetical protein RER_04410 [Rhodococcus erythropolis PR4]|uniref:Uncharacterized protein n=1 Tax=Rhodococcus erythropolis (strain PR4 / NBRC 100887) TaxID=234621 RepID=C0ZN97_RHOE4|nr:hypothetical protein RER_04410 [Rhodococcus erythropolis PR4]
MRKKTDGLVAVRITASTRFARVNCPERIVADPKYPVIVSHLTAFVKCHWTARKIRRYSPAHPLRMYS